jgi:hypothetical protein
MIRLAVIAGAGVGAGVAAALLVAAIDLYITGHGYGSITREVITWEPAGVHLSIGDLAMLVTMVVTAGLTGYLMRDGA